MAMRRVSFFVVQVCRWVARIIAVCPDHWPRLFKTMPRPPITSGKTSVATARPVSKAHKEILFKGVTCALIGLVILLAPYVARSVSVRDLMAQATLVGWFALVLGLAFLVNYAMHRVKTHRSPR